MRVAVIAPPWLSTPPTGYGGTEAVIDSLCRQLRRLGHQVLLFATGDSTCPVERAWVYETAAGVARMTPTVELHHVISAYDAVRQWGAEIVHDHTLVGPVYAQVHDDLAVVTTNHNRFDAELGPLYRAVADRVPVIAISRHQASLARSTPIAAVIHHGVDLSRFPLGHGGDGTALFLGRMSPTKGVRTAIHVARAAGVPLRIAAKMREKGELEYFDACVRPLLGGDVDFVGEVGGDDKLRLLAESRCLLNPIAWPEPFGMVMIEALACGTPVVATPCGAVPEIVDDGVTGFLRRNETGLAAALGSVGSLDRRACRAAVIDRFSVHRLAADHLALFERVLARRHHLGGDGVLGRAGEPA